MIVINEEVKKIMTLIESNGYECFITGGFVRDSIIGRKSNDYDLCTNIPFDRLSELLPYMSMMSQNERRNTGIINSNGLDIEITEYRGENLYEDLFLRDLTMNSVAMDVDGNYIDPLNGIKDVKNMIIKFNPNSIEYDPNAILRAIRFEGILGFNIEKESLNNMFDNKEKLNLVVVERIRKEIFKILLCDNVGDLISKYRDIFYEIIPELKKLEGVSNENSDDLFEHTMSVVNKTSSNIYLRLAALFNDLGVDEFSSFASRLKIDKKTRYNVKKLMTFSKVELNTDTRFMSSFIHEIGVDNLDLLFELKLADISSRTNNLGDCVKELNNLREIYLKFLETKPVIGIKDLDIDGKSLSQMSFDSKLVGVILNDILKKVMNDELENKRNVLEEYVDVKYR
ncbi:MAG: CCA tRNA nucleotidyltransferase [Bacilli bacterium]|nr:CCA tRNA nucleotidyltransferase [Bacilli bacterium]